MSVDAAALGRTRWAIPDGYIPSWSHDQESAHALVSHEAASILNTSDVDALVELMLYFHDRKPAGPYEITVSAKRTVHLRFNDLRDPEPVPKATSYSSVFTSSVPVVIQHTRLDSRQADLALLSTIAYAEGSSDPLDARRPEARPPSGRTSPASECLALVLADVRASLDGVEQPEVDAFKLAVLQAKHVFIAGSGRSGLVMSAFAMRLTQLGLSVHVVGEATVPATKVGDLLVLGSRSGTTAALCGHADAAKREAAHVAVMTSERNSALAELADVLVVVPLPPVPTAGQPLGTLFHQALMIQLDTVVIGLMRSLEQDEGTLAARHANV